jgi:hypothetical protein
MLQELKKLDICFSENTNSVWKKTDCAFTNWEQEQHIIKKMQIDLYESMLK